MEAEYYETIDSPNDEIEIIDSPNDYEDEDEAVEVEEKEEYSEREKQLYARLKKTEAELKEKKDAKTEKKAPAAQANGLSTSDIIALTRANIEDEDIDEVLDYAKYRKISVAEALKSNVVKATLSEKTEERKSAQAVHTTGGRRAGGAVSDERLMSDASKGIMPDSEEDIARIARLKFLKK